MNDISDLVQELLLRDRFFFDDYLLTVHFYRYALGSEGDGNRVASVFARSKIGAVKLSAYPKHIAGDRLLGQSLQFAEKLFRVS